MLHLTESLVWHDVCTASEQAFVFFYPAELFCLHLIFGSRVGVEDLRVLKLGVKLGVGLPMVCH